MNLEHRWPRGPKRSVTPAGWILLAIVALCAWSGSPGPAAGQEDAAGVVQGELDYRAARQAYEAALDHLEAEYNAYTRILDEVRVARSSGDDDARRAALARAYARSQEIQRLERRAQEEREALDARREALLVALDARLEAVQGELAASDVLPYEERRRLESTLSGLASQYLRLEEEGSNVLTPRNVLYPNVVYDPRDTPSEILYKIEFAESKLGQARAQVEELDGQIQRLDNLLRAQRSRRDFMGELDRFGDTQVPVGQPGQRSERGQEAVADTAGITLEGLPLAQQLATLQTFREQMNRVVEVLRERVEDLRARLPRTTDDGA